VSGSEVEGGGEKRKTINEKKARKKPAGPNGTGQKKHTWFDSTIFQNDRARNQEQGTVRKGEKGQMANRG